MLRASCSRYQPIALASSATVGLPGRISSVCHRRSTSPATSSSSAPRSSASPTRRSTRSTDWRDDSVGCAVNTGRSSSRSRASCTSARASPGNSSASRCMRSRSGRWSAGRSERSSRERCSCSAVFASWKYWENARLSATAVPVSSPESSVRDLRAAALRRLPRQPADLLDQLQQLRAAVVGEGPAEHGGQPADVGAQRLVLGLGDDAGGGGDRIGGLGHAGGQARSRSVSLGYSGVVGPLAAVREAVHLHRASARSADASAGGGMSRTGAPHTGPRPERALRNERTTAA